MHLLITIGGSVTLVAAIIYQLRKYTSRTWEMCKNKEKLDGKVVLITGANSGIGYETAKDLSARGATIIMACRNKDLALKAISNIEQQNKLQNKNKLIFMELDLASLQSVTKFCSNVHAEFSDMGLDIIINNAGVSVPGTKHFTKDLFEIHFGVNYLGHFVLTNLLMSLLKQSSDPRVINVSSMLHERGSVNLSDLNYELQKPIHPYADSKLLQIYFGQELAIQCAHINVKVFNVSPGWVYTNLFQHSSIFKMILGIPVALLFMRSAYQGAQTVIHCATYSNFTEHDSGLLYKDCHQVNSKFKFDSCERQELWAKTNSLVKDKGIELHHEF